VLWATYVVLAAIGLVLGVIEAFLVPLRLFNGLEGLSAVLAVVGNVAVGSFGGIGTRTLTGAIAPVVGWFIAVAALLLVAPGGDVVLVGKLPSDPGVVDVGNAFLFLGILAGAGALVVTFRSISRSMKQSAANPGYTNQGNAPTPLT
jgi:hypothetical protein